MILRTTSEPRSARPRLFQVLAVFFVVLYALSAVRGLVPGLCLNLTAPPAAKSVFTGFSFAQIGATACCTNLRVVEKNDGSPRPDAPRNCPFCRLAHGLTETPVFVHFDPLAATVFQPGFAPLADGVTQRIERSQSGRGPPQIASV